MKTKVYQHARIENYIQGLIVLVLSISIIGCKKELLNTNIQSRSVATDRTDMDTLDGFTPFILFSTSSESDIRKALAFAISKEMDLNPSFRSLLYSQLQPNSYRFKEIVIGQLIQQILGAQSVESLLNARLNTLSPFMNLSNPLAFILAQDNLLAIWIPNDFIHSIPNDVFSENIPIVVESANSNNIFINGLSATLSAPQEFFAFHISEARNHQLLNIATKSYMGSNIKFSDYHGFDINDCPEVLSHINSLPNYYLSPGLKLIDPMDDVQEIQNFSCNGGSLSLAPEDPTLNSLPPDSSYECHRASLQLKLRGDFNYHSNHFSGFKLSNLAAFDLINSHPCNEWLENKTRPFNFNWAYAKDGQIQEQPRNKVEACYSSQLLKKTYNWGKSWVWDPNCNCYRYIWQFGTITRTLLFHSFPLGHPVFSASPLNNYWTPEGNGDIVRVDVKLAHLGNCIATNQTVTTNNFNIGGTVNFGRALSQTNNQGNIVGVFGASHSEVKTVVFTINASAVYDLGRAEFEYCQNYPFTGPLPEAPRKWSFIGSTGLVQLELKAPWFN